MKPRTDGQAVSTALVLTLAARIATEIDPAQVLRLVAETIAAELHVSRVIYGEVDLAGQTFNVLLDRTEGVDSLEGQHLLHADSAIVQHYMSGRVLVADERQRIAFSVREEQALRDSDSRNFVAVPLLHEGRLSAVFSVSDHRPRIWTEAEVALVTATGPLIWRALDHHRLLRATGRSATPRTGNRTGYAGTLWVADGRRQVGIPTADVEWIEAAKDYTLIHTVGGRRHIVRQSMAALEKIADPATIIRVHRSAFVAVAAVRMLEVQGERAVLVLRSGATVRVGPHYFEAVRARLGAG